MTRSQRFLAAGLLGLLSTAAASAADLYVDIPVAPPVVVDTESRWDGPYIGVFGGYANGTLEYNSEGTLVDLSASGWLIGANIGIDKALDNGIVLGVVADAAWANIEITTPIDMSVDFLGSLRGRVGYDAGAFLPYLTGGLAVAHLNESGDSAFLVGWTVGAGLEIAATDSLSIDLQYRYSDYGNSPDLFDEGYRGHQATIGLNWAF